MVIVVFDTLKDQLVHNHLDELIPLFYIFFLLLIFSILKHTHERGVGIDPNKILTFIVLLQLLNLKNSVAYAHQIQERVFAFLNRWICVGLFFFLELWRT